jgi:hypothetical protein
MNNRKSSIKSTLILAFFNLYVPLPPCSRWFTISISGLKFPSHTCCQMVRFSSPGNKCHFVTPSWRSVYLWSSGVKWNQDFPERRRGLIWRRWRRRCQLIWHVLRCWVHLVGNIHDAASAVKLPQSWVLCHIHQFQESLKSLVILYSWVDGDWKHQFQLPKFGHLNRSTICKGYKSQSCLQKRGMCNSSTKKEETISSWEWN